MRRLAYSTFRASRYVAEGDAAKVGDERSVAERVDRQP